MVSESQSVRVELITANFRLAGSMPEATEFQRISDVLNGRAEDVVLKDAAVFNLLGAQLEQTNLLRVKKQDVLLAIPQESHDYLEHRRLQRIGIADPSLSRVSALLVLPPFLARGGVSLHSPKDIEAGIRMLSHFFPLLEARLLLEGRLFQDAPVFLVNGDCVLAVGSEEQRPPRLSDANTAADHEMEDTAVLLAKLREEAEEIDFDSPTTGPNEDYELPRGGTAIASG